MTPARLAALGISLALLLVAVWVVFIGLPPSAPAPTNVASVPTPSEGGSIASLPATSSST